MDKDLIEWIDFLRSEITCLESLDLTPVPGGASSENLARRRELSLRIFREELQRAEAQVEKIFLWL